MKAEADELPPAIGGRIRGERERVGLSQDELAAMAGVTGGAIGKIETGGSKSPSLTTALKIAKALKRSPWWLCFGEEDESNGSPSVETGLPSLGDRVTSLEAQLVHLRQALGEATASIEEAEAPRAPGPGAKMKGRGVSRGPQSGHGKRKAR